MKKNFKLNIIDYVICLSLIVCAFILVFRYSDSIFKTILFDFDDNDVIITVKTEAFNKEYSDGLIIGQPVINYDDGSTIGVLSDVEVFETEPYDTQMDNNVYAVLTFESDAYYDGAHYVIGDKRILVNEITRFALPGIYFEGEIISINSSLMQKRDNEN